MPALYVYKGTGQVRAGEPLVELQNSARQCREYLDDYPDKPIIYIFQACDEPAVLDDTWVPLGQIEDQFNTLQRYGLFTGGLGLWAWNAGDFNPMRNDELYEEIKNLFEKIK